MILQGLGFFSVQRNFPVRVHMRVSYGCVGFRLFRVQSGFALRVCLVFLRLGRVLGFSAFRGIFRLGYILGLVTVVQGLGFLGFRVVSRLWLARFAYGLVGFWVFPRLEVFSGQGISWGQFRFLMVYVSQGFEWFRAQGCLGSFTVGWGIGFFRVQRFFAVRVLLRVSYGCVGFRFFSVQSCFALRVGQGR